MSENLFSKFDAVDKQEWFSKIEKEAKGKSIDDFHWHINSHLSQSPFVRPDDLSGNYSGISRLKKQNNWWITEPIKLDKPYESNQAMIRGLEQGASGLRISIERDLDQKEFSEVFKNINFTYIHTLLEVDEISGAENLISELLAFCESNNQDTKEVNGGLRIKNQLSFDGSHLEEKYGERFPNFSFSYAASDDIFGFTETVIHEVGSLTCGLRSLLESKGNHRLIDLDINIGKSYFLNIAKLRAIHVILNNLKKIYQTSTSFKLHARLATQSISDDENQNLIQYTSQCLSGAVGGVDSLCLPASDGDDLYGGSSFRKSLSRNIQSIMQMESFINKVADPAAGSYYIESLTDQIADQAWSYLQNHS